MMNLSIRFARHLPTLAILTAVMALGGCQKPSEPTADNGMQNSTQTAEPQTTKSEQPATSTAQQAPLTILALGDSLTEGLGVDKDDNYPAQLEDRLQAMGYDNAKVINSGLSGETSTGLVNRLDWVLQTKPDVTILTIGANDAIRGIDVATVEDNIRTAVKRLQDNGSIVILDTGVALAAAPVAVAGALPGVATVKRLAPVRPVAMTTGRPAAVSEMVRRAISSLCKPSAVE